MPSKDLGNEKLTGRFVHRVYYSEESGYTIALYDTESSGEVAVVGQELPDAVYPITFLGKWVNNERFGRQFQAEVILQSLPTKENDIINFLPTLKIGIGKRLAKKLLAGIPASEFWTTLSTNPDSFSDYVSEAVAYKLRNKVKNLMAMQAFVAACGTDLKVDMARYRQICSVFHDANAADLLAENPFCFIAAGIPFHELDFYASRHTDYPLDDYRRVLGAIQQVLLDGQAECHSCMPEPLVLDGMERLLREYGGLDRQFCLSALHYSVRQDDICRWQDMYYLPAAFDDETFLVHRLKELAGKENRALKPEKFADFMEKYEAEVGFHLSEEQRNAVYTALTRSVCVITGGPGTGKSSILDAIVRGFKVLYQVEDVCLLAPTGRASVRMAEVTGLGASTIHSRLGLGITEGPVISRKVEETNPVENELVAVDETSMVDLQTAASLVRSLNKRSGYQHLVLIGDPNQLPSVGFGNVLADIIASGSVPVCALNNVYRQEDGNPIITNARKMQEGDPALHYTDSFRLFDLGNENASFEKACVLYKKFVKQHGADQVALLSPYVKEAQRISTKNLNAALQEILNPDVGQGFIKYGKRVFRVNDRVVMMKNTEALSNGDVGTILALKESEDAREYFEIQFECGISQTFFKEDLRHLDLAYALSIHKSQGSQYDTVIIVLPDRSSSFLRRNLIYTGVTRAKKNVFIFGSERVLRYAILNDKYDLRYSGLAKRLAS